MFLTTKLFNIYNDKVSEDFQVNQLNFKDMILTKPQELNEKIFVLSSIENENTKYYQIKATSIEQNNQTSIML